MLPAKLALLGGAVMAGFAWETARPLRKYFVLLAALLLTESAGGWVNGAAWWQRIIGGAAPGFAGQMLRIQILRVTGAGVMMAALLLLRFTRREFFLTRGDLNAPAAPVRWLGIDKGIGWARLGTISAACISLGTLAFLVISGRPLLAAMPRALPFLPWILALAAMNAFGEELSYRAALLAPTAAALEPGQAVLLTGVFFGIGHYYGMPNGIIGVAMAGLLGWYLGKCMVETRGFFWPWLIHFLQDVMIFTFMCAGTILAGAK